MPMFSKGNDLSFAQSLVVKRGRESGLTEDQVSLYATPEFSPEQMEEIRLGILDGLSPSKLRVLADPLVSVDEMRRIRKIYRLSSEIDDGMSRLSEKVKSAERRSLLFSKRSSTKQPPSR